MNHLHLPMSNYVNYQNFHSYEIYFNFNCFYKYDFIYLSYSYYLKKHLNCYKEGLFYLCPNFLVNDPRNLIFHNQNYGF